MNDSRKLSKRHQADLAVSDASDGVTAIFVVVGIVIGCIGWAWIVDSSELSVPVQWLGQGAVISACILVASGGALVLRRSSHGWKRVLRGPATGVVLVLAVWGTTAIAAHWFNPTFASGAWCAALGGFGFVGHKLQQPGGHAGFMLWVYGVFIIVGTLTMYEQL